MKSEQLDSIFFYHLDKAIKAYRQYAQSRLKENGFDITVDQWMVLKVINESPDVRHEELAELVFKDKASVSRIIDMLVVKKYAKREAHSESKKKLNLVVTRTGKDLLKNIRPTVLKNRKYALAEIDEKDLKIAESVLKTISFNCKK